MNFDITLYISRTDLTFYYSQNKSTYKVYEFENNPLIPLYFYSEDTKFSIGHAAKLKFERSFQNTYFDYFKLIKDSDSSFTFFNKEKKIKDLLLVGIEYLINQYLKEIEIKSDKISDLRDKININFVFSSDIKANEINFVGELFKTYGYKNLNLVYFNYLLLNYLDNYRRIGAYKDDHGKIGAFKGYLLIDGFNSNLYIDFYNELNSKVSKFNKIGKDLANDPKDKIIAKMLFDVAVQRSGSLVKEKDELVKLLPLAKKYSNTKKLEPLIKVELSDGSIEKVRLKMKKVEEILSYEASFTKDFDMVRECEKKSKTANLDLSIIVKNSISSSSFIERLKSHYNNVYLFNEEFEEVIQLFNSSPEVIINGNFLTLKESVEKKDEKPITGSPKPVEVALDPKTAPVKPEVPRTKIVKPKVESNTKPSRPKPPPPPPPKREGVKPKVESKSPNRPPRPPKPVVPKNKVKKPNVKSIPSKKKPPPPPPPIRGNKNKMSKPKTKSILKPPPRPSIKGGK